MARGKNVMYLFAGIFAGMAFGSMAALLLAPSSGFEMRDDLSRRAKRMAVRLSGLHPQEWREIAAEERSRTLLRNMERIRSAGL